MEKRGKIEINWTALVICLFIVFFVGFMGSQFTTSAVKSDWYKSIKPDITPPNWVFPIVWNILFFLIAVSLYIVWTKASSLQRVSITTAFGLNFFFNVAWSALYFGMKNLGFAFFDIIFVWLSIVLMMKVTWKIDKKAVYLLIPYLVWVTFAGFLNYLSIL